MSADTEKQAERLGLILSRLASPFDGERAAAALLASRQLSSLGVSWQEFARRALLSEAELERAWAAWAAERAARTEHDAAKRDAEAASPRHAWAEQQTWRYDLKARRELFAWLNMFAPLSDWERGFVSSLNGWKSLTPKQADCLEKIVRKYVAGGP